MVDIALEEDCSSVPSIHLRGSCWTQQVPKNKKYILKYNMYITKNKVNPEILLKEA